MLVMHMAGSDLCIIGDRYGTQFYLVSYSILLTCRGTGKSELARYFGQMLGYEVESLLLYQDMNYRDFLQVPGEIIYSLLFCFVFRKVHSLSRGVSRNLMVTPAGKTAT
jgi:hypothetical protein